MSPSDDIPNFGIGDGIHFGLCKDEIHFWWKHDCDVKLDTWRLATGFQLGTLLPINKETGWIVTQKEPLTVTPSINCPTCKTHGFITNGEWIAV